MAAVANATQGRFGSPTKGGYGEASQFSGSNKSPAKTMYGGSPSRGGRTALSQTDKESVMTGMTKSSPAKGGGFGGPTSIA